MVRGNVAADITFRAFGDYAGKRWHVKPKKINVLLFSLLILLL